MTNKVPSTKNNPKDFQDNDVFESPQVKTTTRFLKFREMVNQYKRINSLTRYLIHIIALIVMAGILVIAYEVFT